VDTGTFTLAPGLVCKSADNDFRILGIDSVESTWEEYYQNARDEFPYLFDEYGFKVVFREEGEGRDRGRDAFGLESDMYKMRIFFSRHGGGDVIFFGPVSALFFDEHFEWILLVNLLYYLNRA